MTVHSLATQPKTIYSIELPVTANEPLTFTVSDPAKASLAPAADGRSVVVTCLVPLTTVPIALTVTGKTAENVSGFIGVTFDPDPSIATSVTLTDVPPA